MNKIKVMELKKMSTAYSKLYEIENTLRTYTDRKGLYFIDLLNAIPSCAFPQELHQKLFRLIPIRNKIAHCHMLTEKEFAQLKEVHLWLRHAADHLNINNI